ncbi:MAG: aminoacyl-tRNA hydrolase [bacterium]
MDNQVQLVVGLGNPGAKYEGTRHNAGADFVRAFAKNHNADLKPESRFFGEAAKVTLAGRDVRLLIPDTYMNVSGKSVAALANFFRIPPEAILVAHDELDLPCGVVRLKRGGGHGGHNGLRDIIASLGNNRDFGRLRIGVGHPGHASQVVSYVLSKAPPQERQQTEDAIERTLREMPAIIGGQWQSAMKNLHTDPANVSE